MLYWGREVREAALAKRVCRRLKSEEGSITLEAALVLPPVLLYVILLFLLGMSVRADMLWQEAAWSSIQEVSLALALYQEEQYTEQLSVTDLQELGIQFLADVVSSESLKARQTYWFEQNTGGSHLMKRLIKNPSGYIRRLEGREELYYVFSYEIPLSPEHTERHFRYPLPYWGGYQSRPLLEEKIGEEEARQEDSIWSAESFTRGQYFRELEGGNLPSNYPVIASFERGTALSIKSMDLTAPSYQNPENVRKNIADHAGKLLAFGGTEDWGRSSITVRGEDIDRRVLRYVIPENSPAELLTVLESERVRLSWQNIQMEWVMRGKSSKYLNEN